MVYDVALIGHNLTSGARDMWSVSTGWKVTFLHIDLFIQKRGEKDRTFFWGCWSGKSMGREDYNAKGSRKRHECKDHPYVDIYLVRVPPPLSKRSCVAPRGCDESPYPYCPWMCSVRPAFPDWCFLPWVLERQMCSLPTGQESNCLQNPVSWEI